MENPDKEVPVVENVTKELFLSEIYPARKPAILRGIELGEAVRTWTPEYLSTTVGSRPVKVHVCPSDKMDFVKKNFAYKNLGFDELVQRASATGPLTEFFYSENEKYYLRALGDDARKDCADFAVQFPEIANDLQLPCYFDDSQFFSSVLRLGSPGIQLWTHYDVMDNVLVQVKGSKRVVLFAPSDALHLYLSSDKSPILDPLEPDLKAYPDYAHAQRWVCTLREGEVLFMPALWSHNVLALDFGVAVNVFWRHLDADMYEKRDPYGNKDPSVAGRALQSLDKSMQSLSALPAEYQQFYALRMMARLREKFCSADADGSGSSEKQESEEDGK
ncbi:tRNA wybutosine-synthesizing protein 5-like [Sycon ciliatum]|uniref:tRNA wybutosine-synthesizing protein 5-like n=1 Tax=Sycon ciliatum TaxID=27933 RepID=UPI0031F6FEB3